MLPIPAPTKQACRLVAWKPFESGALIGKAKVAFRGGWVVSNVPVFRGRDGMLSASGPEAPLVDQTGAQLRDGDGKRRYAKIITFETSEARERWNRAVLDALAAAGIVGGAP